MAKQKDKGGRPSGAFNFNRLAEAAKIYVYEGKGKIASLVESGYDYTYATQNCKRFFDHPYMQELILKYDNERQEEYRRLWEVMRRDAAEIYQKYKSLADETDSDDVKRRIFADILDRCGFGSKSNLVIERPLSPEDEPHIDREIADMMNEMRRNKAFNPDKKEEQEEDK